MKGIILAGGNGTRLYPMTLGVSKQLLPVGGKPLIYYPLSTLMSAGIRDLLIISTPSDLPRFQSVFGSGESFGLSLSYAAQAQPHGIAEAFIIAREFICEEPVTLILGDNVFFGDGLSQRIQAVIEEQPVSGATVFGSRVDHPERFGVLGFEGNTVISVTEKPEFPASKYAVTGLYLFDSKVVGYAKTLMPSARGELEITDLLTRYLEQHMLQVELLSLGNAWFDTGTQDSLSEADRFITALQQQQGICVGCIEEIALRNRWINIDMIREKIKDYPSNVYIDYLRSLVVEGLRVE